MCSKLTSYIKGRSAKLPNSSTSNCDFHDLPPFCSLLITHMWFHSELSRFYNNTVLLKDFLSPFLYKAGRTRECNSRDGPGLHSGKTAACQPAGFDAGEGATVAGQKVFTLFVYQVTDGGSFVSALLAYCGGREYKNKIFSKSSHTTPPTYLALLKFRVFNNIFKYLKQLWKIKDIVSAQNTNPWNSSKRVHLVWNV